MTSWRQRTYVRHAWRRVGGQEVHPYLLAVQWSTVEFFKKVERTRAIIDKQSKTMLLNNINSYCIGIVLNNKLSNRRNSVPHNTAAIFSWLRLD